MAYQDSVATAEVTLPALPPDPTHGRKNSGDSPFKASQTDWGAEADEELLEQIDQ